MGRKSPAAGRGKIFLGWNLNNQRIIFIISPERYNRESGGPARREGQKTEGQK